VVPLVSEAQPTPPYPRKDRFSSLDTLALVRELRSLPRAWFDKASELPGGRLIITLRVQGEGRWEWVIAPGIFSTIRPASLALPETPGPFAMSLRRQLQGAPLLGAEQPGGERYLEVSFGQGREEEPALLAVELFGQGNVLVVRRGQIVTPLHSRAWAQRVLRPGVRYLRPPARRNPFSLTAEELRRALRDSNADRVSTLAARMGLGGPLAEELLTRTGFDPKVPASQEAEDLAEALAQTLPPLLTEIGDRPAGYLYRTRAGAPFIDVTPFPAERWRRDAELVEERRPAFSEAAWEYFASAPPPESTRPREETAPAKDPRAGLLRKRSQQEEAVRALQQEAQALRSQADLLLSHFPEVEERRLSLAQSDPGAGEFEILLEGHPFRLKVGTPTREAAQALYDQAKRASQRLEGAQEALRSTEAQLRSEAASAAPARPVPSPLRPPARQRHFWFEKAPRFFISSEGFVVIAGRDARTNDALVKRYLGEHDVYLHADLHGAPSVVIKVPDPKGPPGEPTLQEAGQWALCQSRAWRAGLASADAFWVLGDQVSKAGASGEYVARGSWVIHGTRHTLRDLPLELTLGRVLYEGEMLLQAAPLSTFARPGAQPLWTLLPGEDRDRERAERALAQALGITREALQAVLPPGGFTALPAGPAAGRRAEAK
jgi:predicted ribosome quality control (RQC) complex YloA/Tae2 family protein